MGASVGGRHWSVNQSTIPELCATENSNNMWVAGGTKGESGWSDTKALEPDQMVGESYEVERTKSEGNNPRRRASKVATFEQSNREKERRLQGKHEGEAGTGLSVVEYAQCRHRTDGTECLQKYVCPSTEWDVANLAFKLVRWLLCSFLFNNRYFRDHACI
ncbi:hypothetical protein TWF694_002682 [Orbilia ellipsospora]|uniref:Uncharacterized protein n=1 Tax=Orbilia ellipsospora TaxID=2528407 RepID=A0AAV9X400_9PEZI